MAEPYNPTDTNTSAPASTVEAHELGPDGIGCAFEACLLDPEECETGCAMGVIRATNHRPPE